MVDPPECRQVLSETAGDMTNGLGAQTMQLETEEKATQERHKQALAELNQLEARVLAKFKVSLPGVHANE